MAVDPIETVAAASRQATQATNVHDAFQRMLAAIQGPFGLWHAGLLRFIGPSVVRIEQVWAPAGSPLTPGLEISCTITPDIEDLVRRLRRGSSVLVSMHEVDLGLLGQAVDLGGTKSIACIPVKDGDEVVGVVCLASTSEGGLDDENLRLLTAMVGAATPALMPSSEART